MPKITTNTGAVLAIRVAFATEVKDKDQFHIDISKAKHKPPKIKKNIFLLSQFTLDELCLSSKSIHTYKKGKARSDL